MRALWLILALLSPLAALIAFQGLVTAGLLPLALFAPFYAVALWRLGDTEQARVQGARLVVLAALSGGLALGPAAVWATRGLGASGVSPLGAGAFLLGAGLGGLAGLAVAPEARALTPEEERRWTLVAALTPEHGRGLALLFLVALPGAVLLGILREAPLFSGAGGGLRTLPEALLGSWASQGYLLLPPGTTMALAVPLSLAPLALGFLTSQRNGLAIGAGGLAALALVPAALALDLSTLTAGGQEVPLSLRAVPAVDALVALAPAGAGALLGAGLAALVFHRAWGPPRYEVGWALLGALAGLAIYGVTSGLGLLLGLAVAAGLLAWRSVQAPVGAALAAGVALGALAGAVAGAGNGVVIGLIAGVVAGGAALSAAGTRALPVPTAAIRSPATLVLGVLVLAVAGAIAWVASGHLASHATPFQAPHARALAAGFQAVLVGRGAALLAWGLAAGALVQYLTGRGAMVALGFLAGPGAALLVAAGSGLRTAWEGHLFQEAREGWFRRGEIGFRLLRIHVLVASILAGEALALGIAGWLLR